MKRPNRRLSQAQSPRESLWAIGLGALLVAAVSLAVPRTRASGKTISPDSRSAGPIRRRAFRDPSPGWKDILLRVYNGISDDRILANAAGVTYYALLALFPGIAAVVSIYGLFADPNTMISHVDAMAGFAPSGAIDVVRDQLTRLSAQGSTTLGVSFLIGLLISLWSANSGIKALFNSLNAVYEEAGKAQLYPAQFSDFILYARDHCFLVGRARLRNRSSGCPQLSSCSPASPLCFWRPLGGRSCWCLSRWA